MKRGLSKIRLVQAGVVVALALVLSVVLFAGLALAPKSTQGFFGPAPAGVTLQCLGGATNYLKQMELMDPSRSWKAFSISNGTSKTFVCTATAVDYRTPAGWISNHWAAAALMTRRDTPAELLPGRSDVFYASVPTSSVPWRLCVGCFEAGWRDFLETHVTGFRRKIQGLPASNTRSWSGRRYEVISGEVSP